MLVTPQAYSMVRHLPENDTGDRNNSLPSDSESPSPQKPNSWAEQYIDPVARRVLPHSIGTLYRYHVNGQNQKPFKPKYVVESKGDAAYRALLPQRGHYPHDNYLQNHLYISGRNGHVYQAVHHKTAQLVTKATNNLESGQVFFYNGILIQKAKNRFTQKYHFFEYPNDRQLCLQETGQLMMPAPDYTCFGGERLTDKPAIKARPVVDKEGELMYVTQIQHQQLTLESCYLAHMGNAAKQDTLMYIADTKEAIYRPNNQETLFAYLKDCTGTVKIYPNRARFYFVSAVSACLGIPISCIFYLYKKITAGKKTTKESSNSAQKKQANKTTIGATLDSKTDTQKIHKSEKNKSSYKNAPAIDTSTTEKPSVKTCIVKFFSSITPKSRSIPLVTP